MTPLKASVASRTNLANTCQINYLLIVSLLDNSIKKYRVNDLLDDVRCVSTDNDFYDSRLPGRMKRHLDIDSGSLS